MLDLQCIIKLPTVKKVGLTSLKFIFSLLYYDCRNILYASDCMFVSLHLIGG